MSGEVALVTGGSRGVGRAVVRRLAADGARVAFSYRRDADAAAEVVRAVTAAGGQARAFAADLAEEGAAARLVAEVTEQLGPPGVFVSNAGIASRGQRTLDTEDAEFLGLFRVHVLAALEGAWAVAPAMRAAGRGAIVFVSSTTTTLRPPGSAPYTAAKAALEAAAAVLAVEERAHGIRVNVVAPGLVATDMGDRLVRAMTARPPAPAPTPAPASAPASAPAPASASAPGSASGPPSPASNVESVFGSSTNLSSTNSGSTGASSTGASSTDAGSTGAGSTATQSPVVRSTLPRSTNESSTPNISTSESSPVRGSTSLGPRSDRAGEAVRGAAAELDAAAPFGRVCRPEDVAAVVAFLTGPDAGYVAGHRLVVDGGGPATGLLPPGAPGPGSG